MTRAEAKAWRARWQRVNEFQTKEIQRMSRVLKLQQANLMFQIAKSMNLRHSLDDPEILAVRKRWVKVKQQYEKDSRRTRATRSNPARRSTTD